jgi:hypothetical protein
MLAIVNTVRDMDRMRQITTVLWRHGFRELGCALVAGVVLTAHWVKDRLADRLDPGCASPRSKRK